LLAVAVAASAPACSSQNTPHPPQVGNCVPVDDASCNPQWGSGVGGPQGGDAAREGDAEAGITEAGSCGVAANYFQPPSPECLPCIEQLQDGCCMALLACVNDTTGCPALLTCAQNPCDAGSGTCLAACEAKWPQAVSAYLDLANCISGTSGTCTFACSGLMLPVQVSPSDQ
jgi:hypothetical protein